jgi:hypothetical protein
MCISAIVLAISAGLSIMGQIKQGKAQKKAANTQARGQDLAAAQNQEAAKQEAGNIRKAGKRQAGASRAALAGAGIVVDSGSGININEDIYRGSESDAYNTLLTGERQASSLNRSASQSRAAGDNAVTGSLLGAASTAARSYAGWKGVK